jgi:hypothetical protein
MSAAWAVAPNATPASMPRANRFKIINFLRGFLFCGVSHREPASRMFHTDDEAMENAVLRRRLNGPLAIAATGL